MKIAFYTLGCKVNQFETGALERLMTDRGHALVPWEEAADAYVVNTCTVTATSDKKSRQCIRGIRSKHPEAVVAVCGCMGQNNPEAAVALDVDIVAGSDDRQGLVRLLEEAVDTRARAVAVSDAAAHTVFERLPAGEFSGRTRALLKVQDGCENFCTYCIIPHVRGPARSLPPDEAAAEAARLAAEGYREIVITGIEISSYGRDLDEPQNLGALAETVCRAAPALRVRLGSLEPRTVTEAFCRTLSQLSQVCPHFHLSLQSGCNETLRRMGRRYDTQMYAQALARLRQFFPHCAITTDLIVGFPGETAEAFARTMTFVEQCGFADMHIFPYSRRTGTPAADMPGQVTRQEKKNRTAAVAALAEQMTRAYLASCVGQEMRVLVEEQTGDTAGGHAENYMPVVCHGAPEALRGQVCKVRIVDATDKTLVGVFQECNR